MKKIVNILMFMLCLCVVSCGDDSNTDTSEIGIIAKAPNVTASGGKLTVTLSVEGDEVVSDQSWCTTSLSGKTVVLNVEANKGLEGRTAIISVIRGTGSISFPITQPGNKIPVAETGNVEFDAHGGVREISVESPLQFEAFVPAEVKWLSVQVDKNKLILTTQHNYTLDNLSTKITLKSGDLETEIDVVQSGIVLIPEKANLVMYNGGDEIVVGVESTLPFTAVSNQSWLKIAVNEDGSVTLNAEDNSGQSMRTATVTLTSESLVAKINVTQRPPLYSDYVGKWTLTGIDNGNKFNYSLTIAQATANSTYKVTGWGKSAVATDSKYAIQANFDPQSGLIYITAQEKLGVYNNQYDIMFYGQVEIEGEVYYITGKNYLCYVGVLQRDGSVQWMNGEVSLQDGDYDVVGAMYMLIDKSTGRATSFTVDSPFMREPIMVKAATANSRSIMSSEGGMQIVKKSASSLIKESKKDFLSGYKLTK